MVHMLHKPSRNLLSMMLFLLRAQTFQGNSMQADQNMAERSHLFFKQTTATPATNEGRSCTRDGSCDGSKWRLAEVPEPPSVTFFTLTSDSDLLPLELMLPHQVEHSSKEGRNRLTTVVVVKSPPNPHMTDLRQHTGDVPFSRVPLREYGEPNGADQVVQADIRTLNDSSIFSRYLVNIGEVETNSLAGLWANGFQPAADDDYERAWEASATALGMLTVLEQCNSSNTTYCAFLEPDVFVHRHADQPGWIDRAVNLLEADPGMIVVQAGRMRASETGGSCSTVESPDGLFSQRYFLLHRERFNAFLPIQVSCAPRCDTFESLVKLPKQLVGHMRCSPSASWVIHAPEHDEALLRLFEGCAKSAGREKELNPTAGGRRLHGNVSNISIPIPAILHEAAGTPHLLQLQRRLAASTWVGLPEFLSHVSSYKHFGHAEVWADGETMPTKLTGWECGHFS